MNNESKLDPYHGVLNPFQIADGINAVKANGARLFKDAKTLYDGKRYPTASSLAILAIEEFGKVPILRRMALATSPDEWKTCWIDFSNHLTKAQGWTVPFLVKTSAETTDEKYRVFRERQDPHLLNSLKQIGIYVGCYAELTGRYQTRLLKRRMPTL